MAAPTGTAPVESILDQNFNDLFVLRIAGNVLGTECLGSFDYAVRHLGSSLKAAIVMGHSGCGAVTAAVDTYLSPTAYGGIAFTHALRSLADRIQVAVRAAAHAFERRLGDQVCKHPNYRAALIETAVYLNSAITAFDLRREATTNFSNQSLSVYYGVFNIATMLVQASPAPTIDEPQLAPAPASTEEFAFLVDQLVATVASASLKSRRIAARCHILVRLLARPAVPPTAGLNPTNPALHPPSRAVSHSVRLRTSALLNNNPVTNAIAVKNM